MLLCVLGHLVICAGHLAEKAFELILVSDMRELDGKLVILGVHVGKV